MRSTLRMAATISLGLIIIAATAFGQRASTPSSTAADATSRIVTAAQAVLNTLDDSGRGKVQFPFEGPQKARWSNLPSPMFQREGLRLADLTPPQRTAVMALLSAALSPM